MTTISSPEISILSALLREPRHGYAIMQWVHEWTDGTYILGPASLYTSLKRLVRDGLVEVSEVGERRITYQITPEGVKYLETYLGEIERSAARMRQLFNLALSPA